MKIAILGAGVAGVSSAILLKRSGYEVVVYERTESPSTIGAGIVVWPNAAFVLDELGVLDQVQSLSGRPEKMRRLTRDNEELGVLDIQAIDRHMGYASFSVLRNDLQNVLLARLESLGVPVHYGHAAVRIAAEGAGGAVVYFGNGTRATADAVVGADGRMASVARRYVHGDNAPVYQGFINWIGVYTSPKDTLGGLDISDYWGVGQRFGIVPVSRRRAYWAAGIASAAIAGRDPAAYKNELHGIFSTWPRPVQGMIEHTPATRINKIYVHDHEPVRTWYKNNVIMIGDAAHAALPTSGQGACQALEDAWHLVDCLRVHAVLQDALREFVARRYDKTTSITQAGRRLAAALFNDNEAYCRARNEDSRQTDYTQMAAAMARIWGQGLPLGRA